MQQRPINGPSTVLMMTHVLRNLPAAKQNAWACSSGSKGYCATKEMLQNGIPGHTLLIESGDLRDVNASIEGCCLLVYCFSGDSSKLHLDCPFHEQMPSSVKHVAVYTNGVRLPQISVNNSCSGFLERCTGLTTLDLSPLSHLKCIPGSFLEGCVGLITLDLSPLSQVTEVQGYFLMECCSLTTLDLSALSKVTKVQEGFLLACTGLTALDLSPLSQVTEVPGWFLQGCSGLTELDLSPLSRVTVVQGGFLHECSSLTALDLSPLSQVREIEEGFLEGCTGLTTLDLGPLTLLREVEEDFLEGCTGIDAVDNPPSQCDPPSGWELVDNQWVRD